jgi:hypothetical protein
VANFVVLIVGWGMALRRKAGVWFVVLVVIVVIIALIPETIQSSLRSMVTEWVEHYSDAIADNNLDDAEADSEDKDKPIEPLTVLIDEELSGYAGIETMVLATSSYFPESKALARVVDIRPLVALKARYNQAVSALNVAKVTERSAAQELKRLNTLAKGVGSVATKKVTYARGIWREANATLQGLAFEVQAVKEAALQSWGATLSEWVFAKDSEQWQRLLSHQDSILLVLLPIDVSLAPDISFIRVARNGMHKQGRKAYLVSPAVATGALSQGESYYFKITTGRLRTGMRLDAWIPTSNVPIEGLFVPDKAMVWYDGHPWVYVEKEQGVYQRRSIENGMPTTGGVFVEASSDDNMQASLAEGEKLVIQGTQMLLSEEFKWQILDEDDDD